eukprot:2211012-Pleurochrysis_carterae.AAC.2
MLRGQGRHQTLLPSPEKDRKAKNACGLHQSYQRATRPMPKKFSRSRGRINSYASLKACGAVARAQCRGALRDVTLVVDVGAAASVGVHVLPLAVRASVPRLHETAQVLERNGASAERIMIESCAVRRTNHGPGGIDKRGSSACSPWDGPNWDGTVTTRARRR